MATAAELRAEADALDAADKAKADKAAEKAEADRVAKLSPADRKAEAKQKADAEENKKIVEDPSDEHLLTTVGLQGPDGVVFAYRKVAANEVRERRLLLDGVNYEHVAEDRWGRWLYRSM